MPNHRTAHIRQRFAATKIGANHIGARRAGGGPSRFAIGEPIMRNLRLAIAAGVIAVLAPLGASAATLTITQSFTITLNPAVNFGGANDLFVGTPFDQFNPALGTLDTIRASISGPAALEAEFAFVNLGLAVESGSRIGLSQGFESNGDINVDLRAFALFTPTYASLVGPERRRFI
jgi:hypothetical protein